MEWTPDAIGLILIWDEIKREKARNQNDNGGFRRSAGRELATALYSEVT